MNSKTRILVATCAMALAPPILATLKQGARAPEFTAEAAQGGKQFTFSLADALKRGPVVVYFYPAAFTPGCTIEAHNFAAAMGEYHALGATVIGVSHDTIETLDKFSVSECHSKFPVAADPDLRIAKSYDATSMWPGHASRTSYVVAPDGNVLYGFSAMGPSEHVKNTLAALHEWRDKNPAGAAPAAATTK